MRDAAGLISTTQITITIQGQNDEQVIATNAGTTLAEGSTGNVITSAMLQTTDVDDAAANLTYTLKLRTHERHIASQRHSLDTGQTFTQANINAGLITYDHNDSQTTSDSFNFIHGQRCSGTSSTAPSTSSSQVSTMHTGGRCSGRPLSATENLWTAIEGAGLVCQTSMRVQAFCA